MKVTIVLSGEYHREVKLAEYVIFKNTNEYKCIKNLILISEKYLFTLDFQSSNQFVSVLPTSCCFLE